MSCDVYQQIFDATVVTLEARINALYAETLTDGQTFNWARDHQPERLLAVRATEREIDGLILEQVPAVEVKKVMLLWARKCLEIFRLRHVWMSQQQQDLGLVGGM